MTTAVYPSSVERFPPSLTGLLAQTVDTGNANNGVQPVTNDAIAYLCPIPSPITITTVWFSLVTAGITLTAGQNLISIHDPLGNILATSPDQSGAWLSGGNQSALLSAGGLRLATPYCWLQVLAVGTTTPVFTAGAIANPCTLGPGIAALGNALRSQRVALGAISLGSFNPATSITRRPLMELGLS
jgi:hypothetical protein